MYQVLARKWRPQTLDELVGQPHVARTLKNAVGGGRMAHAYVFAGLRGTGKTSVARILAKSLNCEKGPAVTPCNECVSCSEIMEGRSLDVMELDAASRTGVDNIREVIAFPKTSSAQCLMTDSPSEVSEKQLVIMLDRNAFTIIHSSKASVFHWQFPGSLCGELPELFRTIIKLSFLSAALLHAHFMPLINALYNCL
jgi:hypothetical protein